MPPPFSIIAAGNTYNPCLVVLKQKGYRLSAEELDGDSRLLWIAAREGVMMSAYSPPELLGIVTLFETFGRDWQAHLRTPHVLREVTHAAEPASADDADHE